MSNFVIDSSRFGGLSYPGVWETSGYTGSVPTISTTDVTNDTALSDGSGASSFANGNAISTTTGNLKCKILSEAVEGSNCIVGMSSYTSASAISDKVLQISGNPSNVYASIRFNEVNNAIPNGEDGDKTPWAQNDIFEIVITGTTHIYKKNDITFATYTGETAGDFNVYSTSDDGRAYLIQLIGS